MRSKKKEAGKKQRDDFWIVLSASAGVVFISVAIVMVVRAYLTAQTDSATNPFAPMTYTNTDSALWKDSPSYTTSFASNAWGAGADSLTTTRKYASAVTVNTGS